jgi:hypothetical protein
MSKSTAAAVESLRQRAQKARARLDLAESKLRKREKSEDLRRKILLGAWLLAKFDDGRRALPEAWATDLSSWLSRPADRALFERMLSEASAAHIAAATP